MKTCLAGYLPLSSEDGHGISGVLVEISPDDVPCLFSVALATTGIDVSSSLYSVVLYEKSP